MAGPSSKPEKKQVSLTSFFTPRSSNGAASSTQSSTQKPALPRIGGRDGAPPDPDLTRKRPLEEDTGSENVSPDRTTKRTKAADDGGGSSNSATATDEGDAAASRPKPNARTEGYAYGAPRSSSAAEIDDEDNDDEATRRKKEDLHRRFVKKLGAPDSIAQIKRRNFHLNDETAAIDGDDADGAADEEEEEEASSVPAARGAKRKGAKTGKLTPMEIQFLDIKRKHMDTILIVEVGYKFRFFGEDARVAAKELHIVCIPGKFRYDEREWPACCCFVRLPFVLTLL